MQCDFLREKISGYIDGELSPEDARLVEEHAKKCIACRELLGALGRNDDLLRCAVEGETDEPRLQALYADTMRKVGGQRVHPFAQRLRSIALLVAAAAAILLGVGIYAYLRWGKGASTGKSDDSTVSRGGERERAVPESAIAEEIAPPEDSIASVLEVCDRLVTEATRPDIAQPSNFMLLQDAIVQDGVIERLSNGAAQARGLNNNDLANHLAGMEAFFVAMTNVDPQENPEEVAVMQRLAGSEEFIARNRGFHQALKEGSFFQDESTRPPMGK